MHHQATDLKPLYQIDAQTQAVIHNGDRNMLDITEQFPLGQRLSLLREIMQRADISATAKNICWLLLIERMNSLTGQCACSNTHIAKQLGIGLASVKRAKLDLRKTGVLDTSTPAQNEPTHKSEISSYRFLRRFGAQNEPTNAQKRAELKMSPAQNEPRSKQQHPTKQFYAKFCSAELEAWTHYYRTTGRGTPPADRNGGWYFPTQWPPGHQVAPQQPTPTNDVATFIRDLRAAPNEVAQ